MAKKRKGRGPWTAAQKKAARDRWAAKNNNAKAEMKTADLGAQSPVSDVLYKNEFIIMHNIQKCLDGLTDNQRRYVVQYFAMKYATPS